jgi:hypothetical protein
MFSTFLKTALHHLRQRLPDRMQWGRKAQKIPLSYSRFLRLAGKMTIASLHFRCPLSGGAAPWASNRFSVNLPSLWKV